MSTRAGWSRRDVLARVAGTGGALALTPSRTWAIDEIQQEGHGLGGLRTVGGLRVRPPLAPEGTAISAAR